MKAVRPGFCGILWCCAVAAQAVEPELRSGECRGVDLLVSEGYPASGAVEYFYGGAVWGAMTAALDATAASVTVIEDLEDLSFMLQFDALWVDQRDHDESFGPGALTAAEEINLAAFIATGRRVVMIGENQFWTNWNNQILGLVGGTFDGEAFGDPLFPITGNEMTWGMTRWTVGTPGKCLG